MTRLSCPNLGHAWFVVIVQSLSHAQLFATPWTTAHQASLSFTVSQSLLRFISTESLRYLTHHPLPPPSPFAFNLCSIRVFSSELALYIRWPKSRNFSFSISPSSEYSGLISFRIVSFDLLAIQGNLKSLLQHHNLKASVLWHSAFFVVQLSHLYTTTRKTTVLTVRTFVSKVMFLLFNTLSRFVIGFLPRSKCLLTS